MALIYGQLEKAQLEMLPSEPANAPLGYVFMDTSEGVVKVKTAAGFVRVQGLTGTAKIITTDSDPSAGSGLAAPIGSLALNETTGEAFTKIGPTNSAWRLLGSPTDGSVTTAKLVNGSVTTDKIADASVTSGKIANTSVTAEKILDGSITTAKLASGAITRSVLPALGVASLSASNLSHTSTSPVQFGSNITHVSYGRPVMIYCTAGGASTGQTTGFQSSGSSGITFNIGIQLLRNNTVIRNFELFGPVASSSGALFTWPPSTLFHIDTPSAGTITYAIKIYRAWTTAATTVAALNMDIVVREL